MAAAYTGLSSRDSTGPQQRKGAVAIGGVDPPSGACMQHLAHPLGLSRRHRRLSGLMAFVAAQAAFRQIKIHLFFGGEGLFAVDAVHQPGFVALTGGVMQQESCQQRLPGLIGEGQPGQGVQKQHEQFLGRFAWLGSGFRQPQQIRSAGQAVKVLPQGVEGFRQGGGDHREVIPPLIDLVFPQGEQLAGVEQGRPRLAASPGEGLHAASGGAEQRQHPVVVPVIGIPKHNGGVIRLAHKVPPSCITLHFAVYHISPPVLTLFSGFFITNRLSENFVSTLVQ